MVIFYPFVKIDHRRLFRYVSSYSLPLVGCFWLILANLFLVFCISNEFMFVSTLYIGYLIFLHPAASCCDPSELSNSNVLSVLGTGYRPRHGRHYSLQRMLPKITRIFTITKKAGLVSIVSYIEIGTPAQLS